MREAKGGFAVEVAAGLAGAGLPLAVVDRAPIPAFARVRDRPAKTALAAIIRKLLTILAAIIRDQPPLKTRLTGNPVPQTWPSVRMRDFGWISFCESTTVAGRKRSTIART